MTLLGLSHLGAPVCGRLLVGLRRLYLDQRLPLGRPWFSPQGGEAAVQEIFDGELSAFSARGETVQN